MAKITWLGQSCFQINVSNGKENSAVIVIDPFDESIGLKMPRLSADLLLITHDHPDHNNIKAVKLASDKTEGGGSFLITGPGEYEIKGIFIEGTPAFHDDVQGKERGRVTVYTIETEGLRFCHLSDLGQKQLTDEQMEKIGSVDILMIPVGGTYTISGQEATKIVSQIEPKIVIPMHYNLPPHLYYRWGAIKPKLDGLEKFLKAMGKNSIAPQEKFSVKNNTLPKEGIEIVILNPHT